MKTLLTTVGLLGLSLSISAQNSIHKNVYSTKMNKEIETVIITPKLIDGATYKTIYLLHGYSGNPDRTYKQDIPDLITKSQKYNTIYVLPNGNFNSWYVDSPVNKSSQYQTFIGKELVDYIDANYPTIKNRKFRGILGWSMGGYGATNIGIAYQNTFSIVGSSCGALDFNRFGESFHNYQVNKVLGEFRSLPKQYFTFDKMEQMQSSNQFYIFDCGTDDTQMIDMNRDFHKLLITKKVEHLYIESLGGHDTKYWSKALSNQLILFENYFSDEKK
ncbi:esterase family protein [Flavobacterium sp. ALJ2]|uniref:alpha/beta hydrolase n=1 Tax=Flavobacterium sp. ALJ2 TaxID=2786960 RepID=UPI00189EAA8E|nr:alpha/beta hydrolase-fold protein [Flavobacterium sp. ALJ2]MBF7091617.1 esterase family protein [Flavobacterium sp. ALJ2]